MLCSDTTGSLFSLWTSEHGRDILEAAQALRHRLRIFVVLSIKCLQLLGFNSLLLAMLTHISYDVRSTEAAERGATNSVLSLLVMLMLWRYHGAHGGFFLLLLLCLLLELIEGAQETYFSSLTPLGYFLRAGFEQMDSPSTAFYISHKVTLSIFFRNDTYMRWTAEHAVRPTSRQWPLCAAVDFVRW